MLIKITINALVGGFVLFIGAFIAFTFLLIMKLFTGMPLVKEQMETVDYFKGMGIESPITMILLILVSLFLCGSFFATLALGLSTVIQNVYLTVLIPFVYYILSATVLKQFHPYLNAQVLFDVNQQGMSFTPRIIYGLIILTFGIILFIAGGSRVEHKNI